MASSVTGRDLQLSLLVQDRRPATTTSFWCRSLRGDRKTEGEDEESCYGTEHCCVKRRQNVASKASNKEHPKDMSVVYR